MMQGNIPSHGISPGERYAAPARGGTKIPLKRKIASTEKHRLAKTHCFGFGFVAGGGKYFLIFALIVTALSNVTLVKDNLEKYVNDSILYPYLKEAGSYLINLDPSDIGLAVTDTTEVVTETNASTDMNSSVDKNITITETNTSVTQ